MIELSTPLLPGLPSGMRPVGVSSGMTSDFALAFTQIAVPAGAALAPALPISAGAASLPITLLDRQIAAVAGKVLPVAVAVEAISQPVVAPTDPDVPATSEPLNTLPSIPEDLPAECGTRHVPLAQPKRSRLPEAQDSSDVSTPALSEPVLPEVPLTNGEPSTPSVSVQLHDSSAAADQVTTGRAGATDIDAPAARPVQSRGPKSSKPDALPPVLVAPVADGASVAAADDSAADPTEPKRDDAPPGCVIDTAAPSLGLALPVLTELLPKSSRDTIGANIGKKGSPSSISSENAPATRRGHSQEVVIVATTERPGAQPPTSGPLAATPNLAKPQNAIVAPGTPNASINRNVLRDAAVASPLSQGTLPIAALSETLAVPSAVAERLAAFAEARTMKSAATAPAGAIQTDASASEPQPAAPATILPAVAGTAAFGSAQPAIGAITVRSPHEAAPVILASIDGNPSAASLIAGNVITAASPAAEQSVASRLEQSIVAVTPQTLSAATAPALAVAETFRAVRAPSRVTADASAPAEPAVGAPAMSPAPTVQPAAQAFAAAMFAAEPTPRSTARTRSTDSVEPLPVDAMLGATAPAPHTAVQPTADTKGAPLDLTRQDWMASMIDRIETIRDDAGGRETRIRLAPDALGTIDLSLRHDEHGELKVHIAAETPQARAILAEAAPRLTDMAEARGLKLGGSFVDAGTSGGDPRRDPQRPETQQPQRPASARGRETTAPDINDERIA